MQAPKDVKPNPKSSQAQHNSAKAKVSRPKVASGKGKASVNETVNGGNHKAPQKKPSRPKAKAPGDSVDIDQGGEGADGGSTQARTGVAAKPRARKSESEGGSGKKRAKKSDGDDGTRHGGIEGLLDDDEDSADRRAVEHLVEAARGNIARSLSPPPAKRPAIEKAARKKGSGGGSRGKGADKADPGLGNGIGDDGDGASAGLSGGSPLRQGGANSALGSPGVSNLPLPGLPQLQQSHEQQELRKRIEQQVQMIRY